MYYIHKVQLKQGGNVKMGQMDDVSDIEQAVIAILAAVVVGSLFLFVTRPANNSDYSKEDVKQKIKKELHEEYGEEFVVDRIGQRSSQGDVFYQARIYPKSIEGTNKRWDDYYHGKASIGIEDGELGGVADTYGEIKRSIELEEFLTPKAKELFGERILFKINQRYERKNKNGYFVSYLNPDLEHVFKVMEKEPERHRLMLDLNLYIFNRIEDEQEKEERREDIFKFVQYLKKEGLFEYLEMRIVFIDERVLAPSYDKFEDKIKSSHKVEVEIEEEDTTVELPPEELRKEMSERLQEEIEEMSEEELLDSMQKIGKDELVYDDHEGIRKWNSQYRALIYSEGMIKERYTSSYEDDPNALRDYEEIDDVKIGTYLEYIYVN